MLPLLALLRSSWSEHGKRLFRNKGEPPLYAFREHNIHIVAHSEEYEKPDDKLVSFPAYIL